MRYKYQNTFTDQAGNILAGGTISVFLAGTDTVASIYAASSGGSAVNSVESDSNGYFSFWIDETDYATSVQLFKLTLSKTNFTTQSYDNVRILPHFTSILLAQENDASSPTLAFGNGLTGFYEISNGLIAVSLGGTRKFQYNGNAFSGATSTTGAILNETATSTNPTLIPYLGDLDTGWGGDGADTLSGIVGGVEALRIAEASGVAALHFPEITTPTAIADFGSVYTKSDNKLYFQDGAGSEDTVVTIADTQTLVSKTLTAPIMTSASSDDLTLTGSPASPPDANTLTKKNIVGVWVSFNGTGTPAYNDTFNISGAAPTDNGQGDYTVLINTDMADANYGVFSGERRSATNDGFGVRIVSKAVGSINVKTIGITTNAEEDFEEINLLVIGAQ